MEEEATQLCRHFHFVLLLRENFLPSVRLVRKRCQTVLGRPLPRLQTLINRIRMRMDQSLIVVFAVRYAMHARR